MTEIDFAALEELITVTDVAEMFEVPNRIVRREAKAGNIPGALQVLGKYGFDSERVTEWTPPEAGTRVVTTREDGRQRYRIYLTVEEAVTLKTQGFEVTDPREAAKARRAARKAAKATGAPAAEAAVEEGDPFADFGA